MTTTTMTRMRTIEFAAASVSRIGPTNVEIRSSTTNLVRSAAAWTKHLATNSSAVESSVAHQPKPTAKDPQAAEFADMERFCRIINRTWKMSSTPAAFGINDDADDADDGDDASIAVIAPTQTQLAPVAGQKADGDPNAWPNPSENKKKKLRKVG